MYSYDNYGFERPMMGGKIIRGANGQDYEVNEGPSFMYIVLMVLLALIVLGLIGFSLGNSSVRSMNRNPNLSDLNSYNNLVGKSFKSLNNPMGVAQITRADQSNNTIMVVTNRISGLPPFGVVSTSSNRLVGRNQTHRLVIAKENGNYLMTITELGATPVVDRFISTSD
jgi:hypothetical protein